MKPTFQWRRDRETEVNLLTKMDRMADGGRAIGRIKGTTGECFGEGQWGHRAN